MISQPESFIVKIFGVYKMTLFRYGSLSEGVTQYFIVMQVSDRACVRACVCVCARKFTDASFAKVSNFRGHFLVFAPAQNVFYDSDTSAQMDLIQET